MKVEIIRLIVGFPILFVLCALVVSTAVKNPKRPVEWAFIVMLSGLMAWLLAHNVSALGTQFYYPNEIIYTLGSLAGISFLFAGSSVAFFCEFFPAGTETPNSKRRIWLVSLVSLAMAPLTFSRSWIDKRGEGAVAGPFYFAISGWGVLLVIGCVLLLLHKYRKHKDARIRTDIRWFLWTLFSTVCVIVIFSLALPSGGNWNLFFLGPSSAILLVSLAVYATLYRETLDFRTRAFRTGVRFAATVLFVGLVMAPLVFLASGVTIQLTAGFLIAFPLALLMGALYQTGLQPYLERLIRGGGRTAEDVIVELFTAGEPSSTHQPLNELLVRTMARVQHALGVTRLAITVVDHQDRVRFVSATPEPWLERLCRRLYFTRFQSDFRIPPELLQALQPVFTLDQSSSEQFMPRSTAFAKRYPRVAQSANRFLAALAKRGYSAAASLNFSADIAGYIMVGKKANGHPILQRDIELLGEIRHALALVFRNQAYHHRLREVRSNAEAEIGKLTEVITRREVKRRNALGKTIIYRSAAMETVLDRVREVASLTRPVFITGETGTGKELIARMVHENFASEAPFVSVNCAALPASLWESEIFGYQKGAFTDAKTDRAGLVSAAAGGSLFFDEIGETPIDIQAKLLRLLQENQYFRLGSQKPEEARCRFLFATNRDLEAMVREGTFREDLYYRINVFGIHIPPLRERRDDIEPLLSFMLDSFADEFGLSSPRLDPAIVKICVRHPWPGNVRELENTILRAMAGARGQELGAVHLPESLKQGNQPATRRARASDPAPAPRDFQELMAAYARGLIVEALQSAGWNKTRAAEQLGIRRSSLEYRMRELNISKQA